MSSCSDVYTMILPLKVYPKWTFFFLRSFLYLMFYLKQVKHSRYKYLTYTLYDIDIKLVEFYYWYFLILKLCILIYIPYSRDINAQVVIKKHVLKINSGLSLWHREFKKNQFLLKKYSFGCYESLKLEKDKLKSMKNATLLFTSAAF